MGGPSTPSKPYTAVWSRATPADPHPPKGPASRRTTLAWIRSPGQACAELPIRPLDDRRCGGNWGVPVRVVTVPAAGSQGGRNPGFQNIMSVRPAAGAGNRTFRATSRFGMPHGKGFHDVVNVVVHDASTRTARPLLATLVCLPACSPPHLLASKLPRHREEDFALTNKKRPGPVLFSRSAFRVRVPPGCSALRTALTTKKRPCPLTSSTTSRIPLAKRSMRLPDPLS